MREKLIEVEALDNSNKGAKVIISFTGPEIEYKAIDHLESKSKCTKYE